MLLLVLPMVRILRFRNGSERGLIRRKNTPKAPTSQSVCRSLFLIINENKLKLFTGETESR